MRSGKGKLHFRSLVSLKSEGSWNQTFVFRQNGNRVNKTMNAECRYQRMIRSIATAEEHRMRKDKTVGVRKKR